MNQARTEMSLEFLALKFRVRAWNLLVFEENNFVGV